MSSERRDGAFEHVGISPDILQPIININDGLNIKNASGHHVLDQKIAGHVTEDDPNDRALCSATVPITSVDEQSGRESPDTVYSDKMMEEQIQRPYEPIAKTLEAEKENTGTDVVQEYSHITSHSEHPASPPFPNNLDVAHIDEGTLRTNAASATEPVQTVQESLKLEDHGINATEIVPAVTDGDPVPSPLLAPSDMTFQTRPHVSEPKTPATATDLSIESQLVPVDASCDEAESASFIPEVENPLETSTVKPEAMDIQPHDTPSREEPQAAGAETAAEVHRLDARDPEDVPVELASTVITPETPFENTEASPVPVAAIEQPVFPLELASTVITPETPFENTEASPVPVAAIEQPVFPVESLMAVDATALAATLLEDDKGPDVLQQELSAIPTETRVDQRSSADEPEATPSVELTPEKAPSVKIEDASADSEVPTHESDSAAVHSIGSSAEQEEPDADVLSVEKGEDVERPKSPWTPSYSVTTQGPGELNILKNVAESDERENIPLSKESTPEIVVGDVDTTEPAKQCDNVLDSQAGADARRHDAEIPAQVNERTSENHATKPQSLAIDVSTPSLRSEELTEERPKSPWTPSYSVTTQGSSPHESAELDQLDQLSPRAVEHPMQGVIDEAVTTGPSEPIGVEASEEADHDIHDITSIQRAATDSGSDEALPDAAAADAETSVPHDVKPVLVTSSPLENDIVPQSPTQLTLDTSSRRLGGEDFSPQSPWTPSYSVLSQGSVREPVEADGVEQMPSDNTDLSDQPNYDHVVPTIETPVPVQPPPEVIIQGDHNENFCDQPIVVPSVDITGSQEFPEILSIHESIADQGGNDVTAQAVSQTSIRDMAQNSPSQLVTDASPNAAEDQDRPTSPWTPSYAVTTQGCATQDSADLDRLEQLPPCSTEPDQNRNQTFDEVTLPTSQGVLLHEPRVAEHTRLEVATLVVEEPTNSSPAMPDTTTSEDPLKICPPWTPSYSVITQGPIASDEQAGSLDQERFGLLQQLLRDRPFRDGIKDDLDLISNVSEPPDTPRSELGTSIPDFDTRSKMSAASSEPGSPTSSRTDLTSFSTDTPDVTVIPATIDSSTLTPVAVEQDDSTLELTPMATFKNVPDIVAGEEASRGSTPESVCEVISGHQVPEVFPGSSNILAGEPQTIHKKPSLLQLTTLDESGPDRPLTSFEMPSSATSRKRLVSTTSSRFFPGGWFSSSPAVPEASRTRTSLDVASGEFIRSPSTESQPPSEAPSSEAASSPSTSGGGDTEEKARWCTIM